MRVQPRLLRLLPLTAALLLLGQPAWRALPAGDNPAVLAPPAALTSLETSLRPLVSRFNENAERLRFVALLSPT